MKPMSVEEIEITQIPDGILKLPMGDLKDTIIAQHEAGWASHYSASRRLAFTILLAYVRGELV
jgi:hypothetical protein